MSEFTSITRPDLKDLIGARSGTSGFQGAHVHGNAFWDEALTWLDRLNMDLSGGSPKRISSSYKSNGVLLPEQKKGGAILGVAAHRFEHVEDFNELVFDRDHPESPKFFNVFREKLDDALSGGLKHFCQRQGGERQGANPQGDAPAARPSRLRGGDRLGAFGIEP